MQHFRRLFSRSARRNVYIFSVLLIITLFGLICTHSDSSLPETALGERYYDQNNNNTVSNNKTTISSKESTQENRSEESEQENTDVTPIFPRKQNATESSTDKPKSSRSEQGSTRPQIVGNKSEPPISTTLSNGTNKEVNATTESSKTFWPYHLNVKKSSAAALLPRKGSLLCWVLTSKKFFASRVPAVNETWLKRCDHGEFYTTEPIKDDNVPFSTVFAGLSDSYNDLFYKSVRALHYTYTHLSKDFDWYFKADDDTYVIVEHLREFLSEYDPKTPLYFGYTWNNNIPRGFNSGGAGYVLSNAAMKIFAEELSNNRTLCPFHEAEDVGIGQCLANVGIYPTSTKNANNEERFSYTFLDEALKIRMRLANDLITLHWEKPDEMRMFDHLLYRVKRKSKHIHIDLVVPN